MKSGHLLLLLLAIGWATSSKGQVVKHSYRFYDNLSVSAPECGPDVTQAQALGNCSPAATAGSFIRDVLPQCGVERTVYHNNMHWGLKYANTTSSITTTYTIQMYVKTTKWGPRNWVRIIDFIPGSAGIDRGIYFKRYDNHNFCLDFWPNGIVGACPFFNDSEYYLLTFTRNGVTGIIDVYVNNTLFKSYTDLDGRFAAQPGNPIYIYRDEGVIPCESGEANFAYLSFTNQYSSQADVNAVYKDICAIANAPTTADFSVTPNPSCSPAQNLTVTYTGDKLVPETDYTIDWNWDGGRVVSGTGTGPYVINWPTSGTKNITLTVKSNACGKPTSKTKQISLGSLALSASTQKGTCSGSSDGVITMTTTNGSPPYQYSLDSVTYQAANTFTVSPRTYTVYVKDATNCVASKSVTVESTNDITLQISKDTVSCQGQAVKLLTTSNATSFSWLPTTGLDNATSKDPLASPTTSTDYIVTATKGTCSRKDTVRITVSPTVSLMPASAPKSCGTFSLSANSTGFVQWSGPGITTTGWTKQDTLSVTVSGNVTYKVRASALATGSCFIEKELTLNFSPPQPYNLTDATKTSCGASVSLSAASSGIWDRFRWQLPNGTIVSQSTITAQTNGKYIVLAGSSSTGCESRDTVTVTIGVAPPAPTTQDKVVCAGGPLISLTAAGTMINWYSDSTLQVRVGTGSTFTPTVSPSQAGLYVYYLTQRVSSTCVSPAARVRVEIKESPTTAQMTKLYTGCFSDLPADTLTLDAGANATATYRWSTPDGSVLSTARTVRVQQAGLYLLSLTNAQQCTTTDTALVQEICLPTLFAPTAFTPNNDKVNDVFEIKGRLTPSFTLSIYNRWGELVLKTDKPVWDGTYLGKQCQNGLYTWQIEMSMPKTSFTQEVYKKIGQVLLIQ